MDLTRLAIPSDPPAPPRVLLVETPTPLAAALAAALTATGMEVESAASHAEALLLLGRSHPGVVLLHAGVAESPARIALLAQGGDCGVIVVLDSDAEAARIEMLDRGADDVLTPWAPVGEIAARVRALHRRVVRTQTPIAYEAPGAILLDPAHRCVLGPQGDRTALSEAEFVALETLLDADGAPVSRDWLGRVALKRPLHSEDRSVDQLVLKLRRKLAAAGASERTILSARRHGYVITDPSRFRSIGATAAESSGPHPLVRAAG